MNKKNYKTLYFHTFQLVHVKTLNIQVIFCILHQDVFVLDTMFFCKVCLSYQYLQNEPTYKSVLQLWIFTYKDRSTSEGVNKNRPPGGTKRTWNWPKICMWTIWVMEQ